jgi:hypothetical protein
VHGKSELAHQRKDVKEFLLGLRDDLNGDIREMEEDKKSYVRNRIAFSYIHNIKLKDSVNRDSLIRYNNALFNTTGLVPNNGRYEGFKSAGKIGTIENRELQNDILDLYQEMIPSLLLTTDYYTGVKMKLGDYLTANLRRTTDTTNNIRTLIKSDEMFYFSQTLMSVEEQLERYNSCIAKIRKITAEIDKEYGPAEQSPTH